MRYYETIYIVDPNLVISELIENTLVVHFREKFNFRRGRINCSLNDNEGWRWFGSQFSINLN